MKYSLEKAPHLSSPKSTRKIMTILSISLLVLAVYAIVWYFVNAGSNYGVNAILIFVVSILTSVFADALWAIPQLTNKKIKSKKERFKNWGIKILDSYGYVSGLIFGLLLPVGTTLYVVFIGAFIGTFLVKSIFGGFGKNIFNPAITARILVGVSFSSQLSTTLGDDVATTVASGASITTVTSTMGWTTNLQGITLTNLFMGNYRGTMGETFAFLIILIGIVLIALKVIDWRITVSFLLTLLFTTFVMGLTSGLGVQSFEFSVRNVMLGGALFGAVFCLTDPVTSPTSRTGKIVFGVGAALITALIRYQASSVEGVGFSIMLMNIMTPMIDRLDTANSDKKLGVKAGVIGGLAGLSLIFGGVYGNLNKTVDTYSDTIERADDNMVLYNMVSDIARNNAGNYVEVEDEVTLTSGECLKKINLTLDDQPASYYELRTDSSDSYNNALTEDKLDENGEVVLDENGEAVQVPMEGHIDFAIIVNSKGVVGYSYIDGTENSLGIIFAQQITIDQDYYYYNGDLATSQVVASGASSATNSTNTVPSILKTMRAAEEDFGLTPNEVIVDTTTEKTKNLNSILAAQNMETVIDSDITEEAIPAITSGTVSSKISGFTFDGDTNAMYYEVTSAPIDIPAENSDGTSTITFGAVVNENGVVGVVYISSVNEGRAKVIFDRLAVITAENPYTTEGGLPSEVVTTGATYSANDSAVPTFDAIIADYNAADVSNLNTILTAQSMDAIVASDVTEEAIPTITSGTVSMKLSGFTFDGDTNAMYYEVTSAAVSVPGEGSDGTITFGAVVNENGVVGVVYISAYNQGRAKVVFDKFAAITATNPYTTEGGIPSEISFSGATYSAEDTAVPTFDALIADYNGGF